MMTLMACGTGFVLDFLFGDPPWPWHPVRLIGALISALEKALRRIFGEEKDALLKAGAVLCVAVLLISTVVPAILLWTAGRLHGGIQFILESFWCYQLLAAKSLKQESMKVYGRVKEGDLPGARKALSMIVGRDTENLDEAGVVRAAVETVAENTSDGVAAPLLFMMIGGAPLGFFYKAANTMDSMVGYKNEQYIYLGRWAAKLDDVLNYIPSRLSAVLMTGAAWILGLDGREAWRIYRRDRRKHASPNSAQTEAACAGALGIRLAGDAWYFGKLHKKEYIGDPGREPEAEDIPRANRLMYGTAVLTFIFAAGARFLAVYKL